MVPPFEAVFPAHMVEWHLDRQPRTIRRYMTYQNCPLPMPEDRLLCILVYLKTYPLQVVQGRLFGLGQSNVNQWIHVLLGVLQAPLQVPRDAPTRSLTELATRVGGRGRSDRDGGADAWTAAHTGARFPLFGHEGAERRIGRPQDPLEQTRCDRGKKKCHTVKNVLLINAALTILVLRDTSAGSTHEKRMAEATPSPPLSYAAPC